MAAFKKGDRVRIRKGAPVRSTHPRHEGAIPSKCAYVITVYGVDEAIPSHLGYAPRPEMVHWAGSGGYWKWCPAEWVEKA
jgi:hypothetical protein